LSPALERSAGQADRPAPFGCGKRAARRSMAQPPQQIFAFSSIGVLPVTNNYDD
jgi:hypothetical protein